MNRKLVTFEFTNEKKEIIFMPTGRGSLFLFVKVYQYLLFRE